MLFAHGLPKLLNFSEKAMNFPDPLGVGAQLSLSMAIFAEVFCAAAIMVGLWTRFAAVPLAITMCVAAFIVHADDPFRKQEFALLYLVPLITLIFTDGGRYALDKIQLKK